MSFWPEADHHRSRLASAYVKLHETMGPQMPALRRGVELLTNALKNSPEDRLTQFWLASGEIARYRSSKAVPHLVKILEEKPGWHLARFRLAIGYHQMGKYQNAIEEYERVIQATPDWMEPYPLLVRLYLSQGNADAAIRLLKRQLSYRSNAIAYVNLALAKNLKGFPLEESLDSIKKALNLNPRLVSAFIAKAYINARAGKFEAAKQNYRKALQIDPQNQDAQAGLKALHAK